MGPMPLCFDCDAILFDMDGTLVNSTAFIEANWRRWAALHSLDAEPILAVCHGRKTSETLREVAPHVDVAKETAWFDTLEANLRDGIVPVPGAAELLATLSPSQWAVVTSASPEIAARRFRLAGLPLPAVLISGRDVPRGKPHPDGYLLAASRLGVPPSRCLVVEDAPAGIEAGRAAGMQLLAITTTHPAGAFPGVTCIADFATAPITIAKC